MANCSSLACQARVLGLKRDLPDAVESSLSFILACNSVGKRFRLISGKSMVRFHSSQLKRRTAIFQVMRIVKW